MNKGLIVIIVLVGLIFLVLAAIYFITPASSLPTFLPGYEASLTKIHYKHAIGSLFLALATFAFVWFQTGKKSDSQKV